MRMMIVDDDPEVTKAIAGLYDWEGLGIDECICFNDGQKALQYGNDNVINILIADIRMPKITGLQLAEEMISYYPEIQIIILSGHDEFSYAQQAIKIGVMDYLLKPFDVTEMVETVKNALSKIKLKETRYHMRDKYYKETNHDNKKLKKQLFMNLDNAEEQISDNAIKSLGIRHPQSSYMAVCIGIVHSSLTEFGVWQEKDDNILCFAIENIVNEVFQNRSIVYYDDKREIEIILFECRSEKLILDEICSCIETIENHLCIKLLVGLGEICRNLSDLNKSYKTAKLNYSNNVFFENHTISFMNHGYVKLGYPAQFEAELTECISYDINKSARAEHLINEYFDRFEKQTANKDDLIYICNMILTMSSSKLAHDGFEEARKYDGVYWALQNKSVANISELRQKMLEGFGKIQNILEKNKRSKNALVVEQLIAYIDDNLSKDLSLTALAKHANFSPGYLAVLVKEQLNTNIQKYVLNKRIEKAKYLLKHTEKRVKEIANEVGYADQRYFSEMFKENVGCKPSEYRAK